jgi:hypothetical protein
MRPLGARSLRRKWVMAHLTAHRFGMVEEAFCQLCRNQASSLALDRKDLPERGRVA